ncbi:hypothetical protein [Pseudomonas serbica]|jgi:hypothetical protein|uniref:hypothetical protein n=1 Tax=Pseudomonas serbica TaxID=2965074 RepID=UPI00237C1B8D|nr:hypothetical protein [Pseudomonas serbica]
MLRKNMMIALQPFHFSEISQARDILARDTSDELSATDLTLVLDRISVALENHQDDLNRLPDLELLEADITISFVKSQPA